MCRKIKTVISVFLITMIFNSAFAQKAIDNQLIYRVLDARLSTRQCKTSDEAIAKLDDFKAELVKEGVLKNQNTEE